MRVQELYEKLRGEMGDNPDAEVTLIIYTQEGHVKADADRLSGGGINDLNIIGEKP